MARGVDAEGKPLPTREASGTSAVACHQVTAPAKAGAQLGNALRPRPQTSQLDPGLRRGGEEVIQRSPSGWRWRSGFSPCGKFCREVRHPNQHQVGRIRWCGLSDAFGKEGLRQALTAATARFAFSATPRLDAELLLAHALGIERSALLLDLDRARPAGLRRPRRPSRAARAGRLYHRHAWLLDDRSGGRAGRAGPARRQRNADRDGGGALREHAARDAARSGNGAGHAAARAARRMARRARSGRRPLGGGAGLGAHQRCGRSRAVPPSCRATGRRRSTGSFDLHPRQSAVHRDR